MPGAPANRSGAVGKLVVRDVGAECLREEILHQGQERAVPTSVVEKPAACKRRNELARQPKAAPWLQRTSAARAEQLLLRIVAGGESGSRFKVQGSRSRLFVAICRTLNHEP